MTVLTEQIDEAAACRGDAPYLEDAVSAATLTYAGLRDSVRAWARHLDEAGIPPGARVAVRLPDPFGYAGALVGILAHVAAAVAAHHWLTPGDRGYCCLPLFHINAEVVGLLATLAAGACLVVDRKFSRRGFWELIETRQITWINAVPAIITILAMDPSVATQGRVRFIRSASAPLAPSALRRFEETFGIPVVETYGMTEAASMITANPLDGPRKAGSAGRPVPRSGWSAGTGICFSRARPARSAGCRSGARASSRSTRRAARPAPSTRTAGSRPATSATWTGTATCGQRRGARAAPGRLRDPGYGPRRAGSGGDTARGMLGGAATAHGADRVLPGAGAAPGRDRQGLPPPAAGTGRGARLTLATAARVPLSPPRAAQRDAAARSMPSATRVAPRTRSSRRRIAARDSQRRARDASSTMPTQ